MESIKNKACVKVPKPRPEIEMMTPYSAPLEGRRNLLRLDFNENTIGPSPKVMAALKTIVAEHISIYPEYNGLQKAVAANINSSTIINPLEINQIGLFNGVDAAIHSICHSFGDRGDQLLTTVPTFGYYKPCAKMQGMEVLEIPYETTTFEFPFNTIKKLLIKNKPKILIICNPNNPTGTNLKANKILELATTSPETLVVIDELYEAFLGDSILPVVNFSRMPNLIVLRSLSKTSGLAGLRIGFAIGHKDVINLIKRVSGPYDINSFAVTAAFAALEDQKYIDNYVQKVLQARNWIQNKLLDNNIKHHMNSGNYFLLWPKRKASEVESSLRKEGILIRNMQDKPLIEGSLRVSIGTTKQMQIFWEGLKTTKSI
tara:strand:+ start:288 stop:1406 length:1119 start_codon:yes stop_codon:yes gene_type:complete